ncbi:transcription initiation factor IIE subunit alpha isoform X1 [Macadamia integrifolia]|uniref:transcription initiation factor IIE subunit alpha isoform X1 n=1 Tax=Macadamia integrifolia TaxID=60698 RepID=UPI001C4EA128|nr:transcription initiation factor IIE subunit alpha isoform X1 [Macadamia integrifolia]
MSVEPFNRLVKLAARAFYDDIAMKGENQPKTGRSDNRGMAVVVLDALTRRQWIREEDLAKDLKLHSKQLRRTLRFFEEEKLITRDHRKETAKGAKIYNAAVAATSDGQIGREGEEKIKLHTHSYCCLDYAQIHDVVRYRLHRMKKKLKDELDNRNTVQEYICPDCGRRYNALDALRLISPNDEYFHCEKCDSELVAESDKLAAEEMGDGDDNARRRRREKLKDMLQKMEVQLKPLMEQLARVKDLAVPEFGGLQAWEARASAAARANGDAAANDSSKASQGQGYGGTPMPFLGETRVEVALSGAEVKEEDTKADAGTNSMKVLPPWMIKQGMNLTKEQRGEVKQDSKIGTSSAPMSDDKKSKVNGKEEKEDEKIIQDEYVKAYYAAFLKRQQEQEEAAKRQEELENKSNASNDVIDIPNDRQVGLKSKRDVYEREDGVEWEEASTAGNANETNILNDLNVQAEASGDDEDEIDWEEG